MDENIVISEMTINDFEEIKDILLDKFDDFWNASILKTEITGQNRKYIVAKKNNEIVGFAGIMFNIQDVELMNIVTKKTNRKQGIGKLLLKTLEEISLKHEKDKIFLEVNSNNTNAINLYKNYGFEVIGLRKEYYNGKDDAILMSKKINNL